ncbi:MAG: hypothetical protein GY800_05580 [Planctomycetes bacterium]|nr:hypothetical protein [Planctomycetota bacterium]
MRSSAAFLMCLAAIFILGCGTMNKINPFGPGTDEESATYDATGQRVGGKPSGGPERPDDTLTSSGPERPEAALHRPEPIKETTAVQETTEEAVVVTPTEEALVERDVTTIEEVPLFTIVYYARGPAGQGGGAVVDKSKSIVYKKAKKAHGGHKIETGPYASYYQLVRKRVLSHWNFLYSDVQGISYKTHENSPIIIDAAIAPSGIIGNVHIVDTAGNPVLAALAKGAVETALIDKFPPQIKADFVSLRFEFYFE